jgi:hypothetical protein
MPCTEFFPPVFLDITPSLCYKQYIIPKGGNPMKVFAFNVNTTMQRAYANYWRCGRLSLRYPSLG